MAEIGSPARAAESRAPIIYGISISFVILSCASVVLRLYTRLAILRTFGLEDVAIAVAQVLSFGVSVTTLLQVGLGGLGRHTEFATQDQFLMGVKALYSNTLVYNAAQIVTKLSFLIQYRRLFPGATIQKVCIIGMVFLAIWGVTQQFLTAFSCFHLHIVSPQLSGKCVPTFIVFNLNSIINIITDFAIFAIPIWPVMNLQMPRRRKMNLVAVFGLGFFACAISIIRLTDLYKYNGTLDPLWDSSAVAYWSVMELNVGILCACLPTLRPLIKQFAPRLLGSTADHTTRYNSNRGDTLQTRRPKPEYEDGIYIQKEVEFESTTELRSKEPAKNSPVHQETWLESGSIELDESPNRKT
ncbi:hypothetical protein CC86DRAFT_179093 [Ophiobolus disseminans]|uniref:Rhodopsin domain-containing protein n=1 Tax=Ophiobolus disseminans TaxID=1469910 RepID=A0A6A7ABQ2_9PLEO|nr:hypothetical protein CC86DRAFT_179093 [Ophiobolus disseminans]